MKETELIRRIRKKTADLQGDISEIREETDVEPIKRLARQYGALCDTLVELLIIRELNVRVMDDIPKEIEDMKKSEIVEYDTKDPERMDDDQRACYLLGYNRAVQDVKDSLADKFEEKSIDMIEEVE
jgi:SHS2 domain-containing protein